MLIILERQLCEYLLLFLYKLNVLYKQEIKQKQTNNINSSSTMETKLKFDRRTSLDANPHQTLRENTFFLLRIFSIEYNPIQTGKKTKKKSFQNPKKRRKIQQTFQQENSFNEIYKMHNKLLSQHLLKGLCCTLYREKKS